MLQARCAMTHFSQQAQKIKANGISLGNKNMCNAKLNIVHILYNTQAKCWETVSVSKSGGSIRDSCPQNELTAMLVSKKTTDKK